MVNEMLNTFLETTITLRRDFQAIFGDGSEMGCHFYSSSLGPAVPTAIGPLGQKKNHGPLGVTRLRPFQENKSPKNKQIFEKKGTSFGRF
jgi:hypothetical protein